VSVASVRKRCFLLSAKQEGMALIVTGTSFIRLLCVHRRCCNLVQIEPNVSGLVLP
jgi:hypothetical protein